MTTITNVRIWWDASVAAYRMASPYNRDLVESFKKAIPISDRSFDPDTKIWTFVDKQYTNVMNMFKLLGVTPTVVTRQQAEAAAQSSSPSGPRRGTPIAELALEFLRLMPYEATLKAYRVAAMQLHPDRGGSMDKMSALNAAWARLEKELYQQ